MVSSALPPNSLPSLSRQVPPLLSRMNPGVAIFLCVKKVFCIRAWRIKSEDNTIFSQRVIECITAASPNEAPCATFIFNLIGYLDTQRPPSAGLKVRAQASLGVGVSELSFLSREVRTNQIQACATAPDQNCAWRPLRLRCIVKLKQVISSASQE